MRNCASGAGTHTPRFLVWAGWPTPSLTNRGRSVWVPAPVRNCALGRDDVRERLRWAIPQLEPLNLPRRRLRQTVHHVDPARIFPRADLLLDVLLQRFMQAVGFGVGAQHDEGLWLQEPLGIGLGDDGGFKHGRVGDQRALDLERRDPDAGDLEHVVGTAAEGVAAVGVTNVFVAGVGPVAL